MKYKIRAFFSGRNGMDTIAKAVMIPAVILMLVNYFIGLNWLRYTIYVISLIGMFYSYFRMFSRNIEKRQKENNAFREFFKIRKLKWKERKEYRYYRCPDCRAWLRVPRGRGEITIRCRVCGKRFDKKT